nr:hypothetical protein HmN_000986100 [Hymenolepis microstoma]CDS31713.1 hypothetical protein HmN_000986300 [Hymenolepis microstoma]
MHFLASGYWLNGVILKNSWVNCLPAKRQRSENLSICWYQLTTTGRHHHNCSHLTSHRVSTDGALFDQRDDEAHQNTMTRSATTIEYTEMKSRNVGLARLTTPKSSPTSKIPQPQFWTPPRVPTCIPYCGCTKPIIDVDFLSRFQLLVQYQRQCPA